MRKIYHEQHQASYDRAIFVGGSRRYGFFSFIFDCVMVMITGGFWLIWILIREMRKR